MEPIRVFVSHSNSDLGVANRLAKAMEKLRMDPFLAHTSIDGGELWRETIHDEVENCDMLVALVTKNFHASEFTGQEVGAAWVLQRPVLCVCVDGATPAGFVAERQGFKYDHAHPDRTAADMLAFALPEIYGERAVAVMLEMLAEPGSVEEAECLAGLLLAREKELTTEQLNAMESALLYGAYAAINVDARLRVEDLLRKRKAGKG